MHVVRVPAVGSSYGEAGGEEGLGADGGEGRHHYHGHQAGEGDELPRPEHGGDLRLSLVDLEGRSSPHPAALLNNNNNNDDDNNNNNTLDFRTP